METHQGVILIIVTGEQRLQPAGLHFLSQRLEAGLQLLQHGIIIFLRCHLADGHEVIPIGKHFFVAGNLCFRLAGFDSHLLAFFGVIPKAGSLLHGMQPLQLTAHSLNVQGIGQTVQRRAAVVELLLIGIKCDIHCNLSLHISIVLLIITDFCLSVKTRILIFVGNLLVLLLFVRFHISDCRSRRNMIHY